MSDSNVSKEHIRAQQVIADILKQFFHVVRIEVPVPVPNPARVMGYANAHHSTKPYYLDVLAESPIWVKINHTKYNTIAVEIDCHKGHDSDRSTTRDETRTTLIKKHYKGIKHIFRYYCKDVIGKKPQLDEEWLLDEWMITPSNEFYADKLDRLTSGKRKNKDHE